MRVAVCGAYAGGLQALRTVANFGCEITLVATTLGGRSINAGLEQFARGLGVPVLSSVEVKGAAFAEKLRSSQTDLLLSVQLPHVICVEALEATRIGCFNLHPSLLPRYAGLHPTSWAISRGEKEHGVTLHWMTSAVDGGPIAFQKAVAISEEDTPPTLLRNCLRAGMPLVSELLTLAAKGECIPRETQDSSKREYFGKDIPGGGQIDWSRPAQEIVNLVRAFDHRPFTCPWGDLTTDALGGQAAVLKAEDTGVESDAAPGVVKQGFEAGVLVAAADHWVRLIEYSELRVTV